MWKDNPLVCFYSTSFTGDETVESVRKKPSSTKAQARPIQRFFGDEPVKKVQIPQIAADYNNKMNAVDIGDQLRSQYGFHHRICRGGWQAITWTFLLDVALINSYLLPQRGQPVWEPLPSQIRWRQEICNSLIRTYVQEAGCRKKFRTGDEVTPISQHNHVQRGKRAACVACKGKRLGERQPKRRPLGEARENRLNCRPQKTTGQGCDKCNVALCDSKYC